MILRRESDANSRQGVRALRLLMGLEPGDGFTEALEAAVKGFQRAHGLDVDGVAGPATLAALAEDLPEVKYKDYSGSAAVRAVQALVGAEIDGKYGKNTRANVKAFQAAAGLAVTGDVGRADWLALWGCGGVGISRGVGGSQPVDYKQADSRWGKLPYTATGSSRQTIASSGCGPTAMADIMATWIDGDITPVEMCAYALKHGFRTPSSGTAWDFFKSVAGDYGFSKFVQTRSMATARAALKAGAFVVASMGPGYWTSGGHYICLWKTDDRYMYANDPASKTRKRQKLAAFEAQRKQFFIFYPPEGA